MSRSDYNWEVIKYGEQDVLCIIDEDRGRMSVTNDIENVTAEIEKELTLQGKSLPTLIVYRDSEHLWDAWSTKKQDFILLSADSQDTAVERLKRINEKKIDVDRR